MTIVKYKNEIYNTKGRWKNEVIYLVFKFLSWVMALNFSRKVHVLQLCAEFSKKPKYVKAICIFHPKVHTIFFHMIWFIGVWAILYEILAIKILRNMLNQQNFNKIIWFRKVSHSIINNYHFLPVPKETFQMYIYKLLYQTFIWLYVIISHTDFIVNLQSVVSLNVTKLLAGSRYHI